MLSLIIEELIGRGLSASAEHPGYITIDCSGPCRLDCGTVNGTWGCDLVDLDDQIVESFESQIPGESIDVNRIADFICCTHTSIEEVRNAQM